MYNHHIIDIEFETEAPCEEMEMLRNTLLDLCNESGATVMNEYFHQFKEPYQGFTGVICLAESHVSIHTWPEHKKMAIDVFICNQEQEQMFLHLFNESFEMLNTRHSMIRRL